MSGRMTHAGADQASPDGEQAPISGRLPDLEQASAQEVLAYGVERFAPRLTIACSFQKEESVLFHMLTAITPDVRAFTIDTGVLFPETLTTWKAFEERFGVKLDVLDATSPGEPWTAQRCCGEAKVAALELALSDVDAWITGIRREQAPTRAATPKFERDERRQIFKLNPLADWSRRTSGATSSSTICPTIRCTTRAMRRSDAPRARSPALAAKAAGPVRTRPSAESTCRRRPAHDA